MPNGLVHHWVGAVFVPGATVDQAVALLRDYDQHARIYRPTVERSKVLARSGDTFKVYLRFVMKKVITVVVNSEHEARFTRDGPDRARSRIVSTRIAEVEEPGTATEREKPVGRDGGYLWRLNSYWRFLQRDDGRLRRVRIDHAHARHPGGIWLAHSALRDEHPARVADVHARSGRGCSCRRMPASTLEALHGLPSGTT